MSAHQKSRAVVEDDLDELDDVLDQFSQPAPTKPPGPQQPTAASAPTSSRVADTDEALMKELADEMASLFKGLGMEPRTDSEDPDDTERERQLAAAWESMLVEGMDTMSGKSSAPAPAPAPAEASSPGPKQDDFQSRIRSTMNKLKESESGLKSSDSATGGDGETLSSLLSQLNNLGGDGDGTVGEEQLEGVLEAMMGQLMSKDVLYEPLKELHDKFPGYLAENSNTISPEDKKRFEAQISCIKLLLDEFESKTYRDEDEKARGRIVELMGELQTHGSPPEKIMGPLPSGFTMGTDGLPEIPDCNIH